MIPAQALLLHNVNRTGQEPPKDNDLVYLSILFPQLEAVFMEVQFLRDEVERLAAELHHADY